VGISRESLCKRFKRTEPILACGRDSIYTPYPASWHGRTHLQPAKKAEVVLRRYGGMVIYEAPEYKIVDDSHIVFAEGKPATPNPNTRSRNYILPSKWQIQIIWP